MTFNLYMDDNGNWCWQLVAANHHIIAKSCTGYKRKEDCLDAIRQLQELKDVQIVEEY